VINPDQAHTCAKAVLRRAKTDALDARTLARLAATRQPAPWTPPPSIYAELQQRLAERDTLIGLRQQVPTNGTPWGACSSLSQPCTCMEGLIATLDAQIAAIEREITRSCRHRVGVRWSIDETSMRIAGQWYDTFRAIDIAWPRHRRLRQPHARYGRSHRLLDPCRGEYGDAATHGNDGQSANLPAGFRGGAAGG